jgi:hypothetical protein
MDAAKGPLYFCVPVQLLQAICLHSSLDSGLDVSSYCKHVTDVFTFLPTARTSRIF